jgi:hypothetical protein
MVIFFAEKKGIISQLRRVITKPESESVGAYFEQLTEN